MRDHWHKGRGFVKAHVAVDVETLEVLAVVATDDHVSNCRAFKELIEQVLERGIVVCRVLTNGACNTGGAFDLLCEQDIEAGIRHKRAPR